MRASSDLIEIYNEDCVAALLKRKTKDIDIIVTSPPYNIGIDYGVYKDKLSHDDYMLWMERVARAFAHVLKPDGHLFLNIANLPKKPTLAFDILNKFLNHFKIQNQILWIKSMSVNGVTRGHFQPITSKRFLNQTNEFIFHLTKNGNVPINRLAVGVPFMDASNIKRFKYNKMNLRCNGNSWFLEYDTVNEKKDHPCSFPKSLPINCIKMAGYDASTVILDPFLGSGASLVAAQELGVNFLGYELDNIHFTKAKNKILI